MSIPQRAVEAAARAEEDALCPGAWDEMSDIGQKLRMDRLCPILEAAAPFILAQENLEIACEMPGLTHAQAAWLAKRRGDPLWDV